MSRRVDLPKISDGLPGMRFVFRSALVLVGLALAGCGPHPRMLTAQQQTPIDRSVLSCPSGFAVQPFIRGLSAPTSIAWDESGSLLVAEGGGYEDEPRIIGFRPDGGMFTLYPYNRKFPFDLGKSGFRLYGPIGGMVVYKGRVYVSHRDSDGYGRITALDYRGGYTTIAAHLPAQGDHAVTDLAIDPRLGRLFFGVGSATNSGVVGLDNWEWVQDAQQVRDQPWGRLHLRGYRFDSPNPFSGLFGPADIAVTAPYQAFNVSNETEVNGSDLPSAAIYSCSPNGGDVRVEAHGIRYPRGIAFNGYSFYFTNEGMKLRGTRPVKNDPDALLRLIPGGSWYGWPDYTADLKPVYDDRYQPPESMIAHTGSKRVLFVIDQQATNNDPKGVQLLEPNRETLLKGVFAPLSGAAKFDFAPGNGPFKQFRGKAIVALSGDRAPFDTSGQPVIGPIGYKVVVVDSDTQQVSDFVRNTADGPGSRIDGKNLSLLERPVDVKFGPDGSMYILDAGRSQVRRGRDVWESGTGQIFRLVPIAQPVMYR